MIMRVPFGDWSKDGHGIYREVWVSVPTWDSIPKAQAYVKDHYGEDFFRTMSNNYDELFLEKIHWEAAYEAGFDLEHFRSHYRQETICWNGLNNEPDLVDFTKDIIDCAEDWNVYIDALIEIFFMIINEHGANATILNYNPFPYNYNIEDVGYGALSAEDY